MFEFTLCLSGCGWFRASSFLTRIGGAAYCMELWPREMRARAPPCGRSCICISSNAISHSDRALAWSASERCAPVYGAGWPPSSLARNYRPTPVRLLPDANQPMRSYSTAPRAAQSDRERVRNLDHRRKLAQALSCVPLHCPMRRLWPLQDADMICLSYPISSLSHDDAALRHCSSVGQP